MSELKPCPFCGNDEIQRYNYEPNKWRVTCRDCRNTTKDWPTLDEAIESWNTRVDDAKLQLAVVALVDILHMNYKIHPECECVEVHDKIAKEALAKIGEQQ